MEDLIENGKNNKWVVCKFCESKVLRPSTACYEEREVGVPCAHIIDITAGSKGRMEVRG